jgi:hypothetical protein
MRTEIPSYTKASLICRRIFPRCEEQKRCEAGDDRQLTYGQRCMEDVGQNETRRG